MAREPLQDRDASGPSRHGGRDRPPASAVAAAPPGAGSEPRPAPRPAAVMSLQRRLLIYLLVCAPLVWGTALLISIRQARLEVNELFDSEIIRFARQVQATLHPQPGPPDDAPGPVREGAADMRDLVIGMWDGEDRPRLSDREGVELPLLRGTEGFVDLVLEGDDWRVYYLPSRPGGWRVAVGQRAIERDEMSYGMSLGQVLPWLLMLPVLLLAMAWAVRASLAPLRRLTGDLERREAADLQPLAEAPTPVELRPMVDAINGLLQRIRAAFERERRFTADAAHELRTPLAVLRAQWDVVRRARGEAERREAEAQLSAGIDRLDRLVMQMLALSRVEAREAAAPSREAIDWRPLVEQVASDCLPLAARRRVELAVEGLPEADAAVPTFPLRGDPALLAVMLRNLLDNALRYATPSTTVQLRFGADGLEVENAGVRLAPDQLARLGERFSRPDGQEEGGSGLGLSIASRVARRHALDLSWQPGSQGGLRVTVRRAGAGAGPAVAPVS